MAAKFKMAAISVTTGRILTKSKTAAKQSDVGNTFKCDGCEFVPETEQMLKAHVNWEHGNKKEKDKQSDAVNTFNHDECEFMAETE